MFNANMYGGVSQMAPTISRPPIPSFVNSAPSPYAVTGQPMSSAYSVGGAGYPINPSSGVGMPGAAANPYASMPTQVPQRMVSTPASIQGMGNAHMGVQRLQSSVNAPAAVQGTGNAQMDVQRLTSMPCATGGSAQVSVGPPVQPAKVGNGSVALPVKTGVAQNLQVGGSLPVPATNGVQQVAQVGTVVTSVPPASSPDRAVNALVSPRARRVSSVDFTAAPQQVIEPVPPTPETRRRISVLATPRGRACASGPWQGRRVRTESDVSGQLLVNTSNAFFASSLRGGPDYSLKTKKLVTTPAASGQDNVKFGGGIRSADRKATVELTSDIVKEHTIFHYPTYSSRA